MPVTLTQFTSMFTTLMNSGETRIQQLLKQISDGSRDSDRREHDIRESAELIAALQFVKQWSDGIKADAIEIVDVPLPVIDGSETPLEGSGLVNVSISYSYDHPGVHLRIGSLAIRIEHYTPRTLMITLWKDRESDATPDYQHEFNIETLFQTEEDEELSAEELAEKFGTWASHPRYLLEDWRHVVGTGETRLGYWEWVVTKLQTRLDQIRVDAMPHEACDTEE